MMFEFCEPISLGAFEATVLTQCLQRIESRLACEGDPYGRTPCGCSSCESHREIESCINILAKPEAKK